MIAENYYSGLCVGGPMDGKYQNFDKPWFEVAKPINFVEQFPSFSSVMDAMTYERYRYEHVVGLRSGPDRDFHIDFWVDKKDFPTVESIFHHVFGEYGREKRGAR